jgi:pimeloyl-ACP methyl ester carboxylesterase
MSTPIFADIVNKKNNFNDFVVLLHGLSRSSSSMKPLEKALLKQGFRVINLDYSSRKFPIEILVENIARQIKAKGIDSANKVHFVTHSLGGIITRWYIKENRPKNLGRVVMLSPPNQGSEIVDCLRNYGWYQWITGPVGQQLGTDSSSVPNQLGSVDFELGIITGNRTIDPVGSWLIPGENDGRVSVKRAKVAGMSDFLVLPHSHAFIMSRDNVMAQVIYFLINGKFRR